MAYVIFSLTLVSVILFGLYGAPGSLALQCKRFSTLLKCKGTNKKVKVKVKPSDYLQAYCPIWQIVYTHKVFYYEPGWTAVMAFAIVALIFLRLMVYFFVPNTLLLTLTGFGSIIAIILHQLFYSIAYFDIAIMYSLPFYIKVLIFILPQLAAILMGHMIPEAMLKVSKDLDSTFKESI